MRHEKMHTVHVIFYVHLLYMKDSISVLDFSKTNVDWDWTLAQIVFCQHL